jgi:hypothetical protein
MLTYRQFLNETTEITDSTSEKDVYNFVCQLTQPRPDLEHIIMKYPACIFMYMQAFGKKALARSRACSS